MISRFQHTVRQTMKLLIQIPIWALIRIFVRVVGGRPKSHSGAGLIEYGFTESELTTVYRALDLLRRRSWTTKFMKRQRLVIVGTVMREGYGWSGPLLFLGASQKDMDARGLARHLYACVLNRALICRYYWNPTMFHQGRLRYVQHLVARFRGDLDRVPPALVSPRLMDRRP